MKEKIWENYNYKVNYLFYRKNITSFLYNDKYYILQKTEKTEEDLESLLNITKYLENYGIFFHEIIKTVNNNYRFEFGGSYYVLMHARIIADRVVTEEEIIKLISIPINDLSLPIVEPASKLIRKVDLIEQYIANYESNYEPAIMELNYYIGLAENSIALYNLVDYKKMPFSISHFRLKYGEKVIDFYNPLEIVLDFRIRDLAEYSKDSFYRHGINLAPKFLGYLNQSEYLIYLSRLLYPSIYFDNLDNVIMNNGDLNALKKVSLKANDYELMIKNLYSLMQKYASLPNIEWLSNINNF